MRTTFIALTVALLGPMLFAPRAMAVDPEWTARRADARVSIQQAVASETGLSIEFSAAKRGAPQGDYERWSAPIRGELRFAIEHGHYAVPGAGRLDGLRAVFRAAGRER